MTTLKRILVPTDFSPSADVALASALALARRHDAEVRLLRVIVVQTYDPFTPGYHYSDPASLREFLESRHHEVLEASDGAQAFTIAEAEMPHLIIMDVVMPGVYGSTATKRIQDYWRTSEIPIIIMSGTVGQSVLKSLLKRPNVRYLKKPVDLRLLESTIKKLLPEGGYTK